MSGIYTLLSASKALQRKIDVTSNNLANVNTPGYKSDKAVFKEYLTKSIGQDLESEEEQFVHHEFISPFSNGGNSFAVTDTVTPNMSNGRFRKTERNLDFALGKQGFFAVQTPQGKRYTRDGQFEIDSKGFLVTQSGDKVLGSKGFIQMKGKDFVVGKDGVVTENGVESNRLLVVRFPKESSMTKMGNSLWATSFEGQQPKIMDDPLIHQGMVEDSNVNSVEEMVQLLTVNRSFEASINAMGMIDELDEQAISISEV